MNFARDLKTGQFVCHATVKEVAATGIAQDIEIKTVPSTEKESPIAQLSKKTVKVTTEVHLSVFSSKKLDEKSQSRMRPGTEVILDFLEATAPDKKNQLVRVRKDGSTRTFYTTATFAKEVIK